MSEQPFNAPRLLDPQGKPASSQAPDVCPGCGAGKKDRGPSCGFGEPHPICNVCGYEFRGFKWQP